MDSDGSSQLGFLTGRLKKGTWAIYLLSFFVILILTAYGIYRMELGESLVGVPMLIILGAALFTERKSIHVPPAMIVFVIVAFFLATASRTFADEETWIQWLANVLTGINLGIMGLILVYVLIRSMPGMQGENRMIASFLVICVAIASYVLVRLLQAVLSVLFDVNSGITEGILMDETAGILIGAFVVAIVYGYDARSNIFGGILSSFLEENSEIIGMKDMEKYQIQRLIEEGESEWLEFKSTLRINLQTGEKDARMERAVLKTLVAFMNSEGGNLLIGVADDGTIIGSDVHSFESKDKMGLHLSNIFTSQIGKQFLPYMTFRMVDFNSEDADYITEQRTVIRVICQPCPKPVFLKDGKIEIFYVRKGPQTEEFTGTALLNYVSNRSREIRRIKRFS